MKIVGFTTVGISADAETVDLTVATERGAETLTFPHEFIQKFIVVLHRLGHDAAINRTKLGILPPAGTQTYAPFHVIRSQVTPGPEFGIRFETKEGITVEVSMPTLQLQELLRLASERLEEVPRPHLPN